jgi:hypothetical protein
MILNYIRLKLKRGGKPSPLFVITNYASIKKKLFAPKVQQALSDKKFTSITSLSEVLAPPAEPVIQVL